MKFGQSKEHNVRIIFLAVSFTKSDGETTPRHSKLSIYLDQ